MQLFNPRLEATLVKAICSFGAVESGMLMARLSEDSFYTQQGQEAFEYVKREALMSDAIPQWDTVLASASLSDDTREFLIETKLERIKSSKTEVERLLSSAQRYETARMLYNGCNDVIDKLTGDTPDLDELKSQVTELSSSVNTNIKGVREQIYNIGKGNNTKDLVEACLDGNKTKVIPTGFRAFDELNGGIPVGDLMVGAGPTGGGKTAIMAIQLLLNMSQYAPTVLVPLEMTAQQTMDRVLSNLSKVKINKFTSGTLTDDDKIRVRKAYKRFAMEQKKRDTRYAIWDPERDVTLEEVLTSLLPFDYEVILIDYIGLLKGMDDEQQWRKLGAAARTAKIFAKTHGKTVILLAQLGDDMKVRYSKAISEHAANAWMWQFTQAERDSGIITIVPFKSRNQDPTPFDLAFDFSIMRAGDATEADFQDREDRSNGRKVSGKKGSSTKTFSGESDMRKRVENTKSKLVSFANDIDEMDLDDEDDD